MKTISPLIIVFILILWTPSHSQTINLDVTNNLIFDVCRYCPIWSQCLNNTCIPTQAICSIIQCPQGYYCDLGDCKKTQTPCSNQTDCLQYQTCINQICTEINNSQQISNLINNTQSSTNQINNCSNQCKQNQICLNNQCEMKEQNSSTDDDPCLKLNCSNGTICLPGQSQCTTIPSYNIKNCYISPCQSGYTCYYGFCKQNDISDQNCSNKCNSQTQICINKQCFSINQNINNFCKDVECSNNQICSFGSCIPKNYQQSLCKQNTCKNQEETICYFGFCFANTIKKNADLCNQKKCQSGAICVNGNCIQPLKVFEGLCNNIICKTGQACMYGQCYEEQVMKNCKQLNCSSDSICIYGQCVLIFSSFNNLFNQNEKNENQEDQTQYQAKLIENPLNSDLSGLLGCKTACKNGQLCIQGVCRSLGLEVDCNPVCKQNQKCIFGYCLPF